jgi:hypothetical protein
MRHGSPIESLHDSLSDAYHRLGVDRFDLDREGDVDLWQQTWGSTSCGHAGIGGSAMTIADVVAVEYRDRLLVYSAGKLLHEASATVNREAYDTLSLQVKDRNVLPAWVRRRE